MPTHGETRCSRCRTEKPKAEFYSNGYCRPCQSSYCADRAALRDEAHRAVGLRAPSAKYQANKRTKLLAALGGKCECCGEARRQFLAVDHIHGDGSKDRKAGISIFLAVKLNPERFRLLCHNCNQGREQNGGVCPHAVPLVIDTYGFTA